MVAEKIENIKKVLSEIEKKDINPSSGKLFAYVYETGDEVLKKIAAEALLKFFDKNMLDFTVFKSSIEFEKYVVGFAKKLMHGDEEVVGTYTYGGTESVLLAVKTARDFHLKNKGTAPPEIVVPVTIHPSFYKAANYFGLKVKKTPIDSNLKVDVETLKNEVTDKTALIALSAPNWPYGTIDPIREVAEYAKDKNILLHVDACLGGFILPFLERLGEKIHPYDFRVEGVTSISLDIHKYGYAPKGSSILLFKNPDLKKFSLYVDVSSPGYIFVNPAILSSRSIGPLAAAFAVVKYLGDDGYMEFATRVLSARNKIYEGLRKIGFETVAPIESSILSLYYKSGSLIPFVISMRKRGWHVPIQRGLKKYSIPPNIHLTISPIHSSVAEEFVKDASNALAEKPEEADLEILESIEKGDLDKILSGLQSGRLDSAVIPLFLDYIPEDVAVEIIKEIVIAWYS